MKSKKYLIIIFICLLITSLKIAATNYYVDFDNGSDSNSGTSENTAWKHCPGDVNATGNSAGTTPAPGDVIYFKGEVTYRGNFTIKSSGNAGNPITYKGDGWGSSKAILDGSEVLTGWSLCTSAAECGGNSNWQNIYYTYVPGNLNSKVFTANLHENDEFLWLAQEPDLPDPFYRDETKYYYTLPIGAMDTTSLVDPVLLNQTDPNYWKNSSVMLWVQPNIIATRDILSFDPASHKITYANVGDAGVYTDRQTYYCFINSINALDKAGEYYFSPVAETDGSHKVYLWPRNVSHLSQGIEISTRSFGIDISTNSYLVIEGFHVQQYSGDGLFDCGIGTLSGWNDREQIVVRNNDIHHDAHASGGYGGVYLRNCNNSLVENNTIEENVLTTGMCITSSHDNIARGNIIRKPGHTGMWFFTVTNGQILNNTVTDVFGTHGNGITCYLSCKNILIAWNKLKSAGSGFTFQEGTNFYFYRNLVDANDGESNVNEWSEDQGTIAFMNNTFVRNSRNYAMHAGYPNAGKYIMINNIIDGGGSDASIQRSNNLYVGLAWDQDTRYGWNLAEGEKVQTDVNLIFTDPANGNFHLKTGSLAIDSGVDISAYLPVTLFPDVDFEKDLDGNSLPVNGAYDIGAYEFDPNLTSINTPGPKFITGTNQSGWYNPYPNPFNPTKGQKLIFPNVNQNSTLMIYNIVEKLIREIISNNSVRIEWDGKNNQGQVVYEGIYIYVIKDEYSSKTTGKIIVIR